MIQLPRRIVLFGVSGSGKSTLGNNLHQRFGYCSIGFADPIKRAAKEIFGFADGHLYGPSPLRETPYEAFKFGGVCPSCLEDCYYTNPESSEEEKRTWLCESCETAYPRYITPRLALQTLGTEWGRGLCEDIWARACFLHMRPLASYVVTDGRFINELEVAHANGACTVLLRRGLSTSTSSHPSEQEVRTMAVRPDLFHIALANDTGSAEENFELLLDILQNKLCMRNLDLGHFEDRKAGL
jgi:hypothetical protein